MISCKLILKSGKDVGTVDISATLVPTIRYRGKSYYIVKAKIMDVADKLLLTVEEIANVR